MATTLIPFKMEAEWVSLNSNKSTPAPPNITILSNDINSTVLKIEVSGFNMNPIISDNKSYNSVDLLSEIFTNNPGFPALPYIATTLIVPDQSGISVEVLETGLVQSFKDIYLPPSRASWFEGKPETAFLENEAAYKSSDVFPIEFASIESPSVFRDFRIARLSVFPVRYNAESRELLVTTSITVRVNFTKGMAVNPKMTPKRAIAPSFGKLYRSFLSNYQSVLNKEYNGV
ncbi:MAG: C25 family peptidase propeptide domain-containing protein, partial [Bacteroidales bacterium]